MKTLGLIGGTSWHSTIEYYRYINSLTEERQEGPPQNPPLLMYSLNVDLMRRGDWEEIDQAYLKIANNLQRAGADAILICANTPHKVYSFVAPQLEIPILHIADAIGKEAQRLGLEKLGWLGTLPTMQEDYIQQRLADRFDLQTQIPDRRNRVQVHRLIVEELTRGIFTEEAKKYVIQEMEKMKQAGAEGIVLGCTELPLLLTQEDFDLPLLDTTRLHAQMAVDFILS
jgi:aspartate racemase